MEMTAKDSRCRIGVALASLDQGGAHARRRAVVRSVPDAVTSTFPVWMVSERRSHEVATDASAVCRAAIVAHR